MQHIFNIPNANKGVHALEQEKGEEEEDLKISGRRRAFTSSMHYAVTWTSCSVSKQGKSMLKKRMVIKCILVDKCFPIRKN